MSVVLEGGVIRLLGDCRVEDAEKLVALLQGEAAPRVDIAAALHLHTAVVQVLLAFRPAVVGISADRFIAEWLAPGLMQPIRGD